MAARRDTFVLGLVAIIVFVLFFGTILYIGGGEMFTGDVIGVTVRFPTDDPLPTELKAGGAVFYGMTRIGTVLAVTLEEVDGLPFVAINLTAPSSIGLRSDCRMVARGALLGGGGKIVVLSRGEQGKLLVEGDVVDGVQAGSLDATLDILSAEMDSENPGGLLAAVKTQLDPAEATSIVAKVHRSLDDVNGFTRALSRQLASDEQDALMTKLHRIADNVNSITGHLRDEVTPDRDGVVLAKIHVALDRLDEALIQAASLIRENRSSVGNAITSIEHAAATLDEGILDRVAGQLDGNRADSLVSQIRRAIVDLDTTLKNTATLTGRLKRIVLLNATRISQLIANLKETTEHLKSAGKDIRRNPWRLLYRPSLEESAQLNTFDAARELAETAARLDNVMIQLRSFIEDVDGDVATNDADLSAIRTHLLETFERFREAEQALWKQLDSP